MALELEKLSVNNLEALLQALGQRKDKPGGIFLLLCGDVVAESGESWCSDCVKAEPLIAKVLEEVKSGVFIRCSVGDRAAWKDPENVFRQHPQLQLSGVPTLIKWATPRRLGPEECGKEDLLRLFFLEEED